MGPADDAATGEGPGPGAAATTSRRRRLLRWAWRHPGATGYGLAAVLTGCLAAVLVSSSERWDPSTAGLPPNQAGYLWCCDATDVGATWTVPHLMHAAPQSAEGVWIGLQTSGSFFLQVGTQANQSDFAPKYQAFWSDGPLHGAPVDLGNVKPGDVVRARLSQSGAERWTITFADQTQHWSQVRQLTYAQPSAHAFAEWIEEDPALVVPFERARLFVMARTGGTEVAHLEVNGRTPAANILEPESFVDASHRSFAPSVVRHNSFHFLPW